MITHSRDPGPSARSGRDPVAVGYELTKPQYKMVKRLKEGEGHFPRGARRMTAEKLLDLGIVSWQNGVELTEFGHEVAEHVS